MPGNQQPPAAEISVGGVGFDGDLLLFQDNDFPTADLMIHNHYERDGSVYACAQASPEPFQGSLTGVVKLAATTEYMVSEWTSSNVGKHPPVPDPDIGSGWVLMDVNASLAMVAAGPGGDGVYRVSGSYVYCRTAPVQDHRRALTGFAYPYAPWIQPGGVPRTVPLEALAQLIADRGGQLQGTTASPSGQGILGQIPFVQKG